MPMRGRSGFTFIEILIVMILIGLIAAFALPRFTTLQTGMSVRSAKQEVAALLANARAAAIQNGRVASFIRTGNAIAVAVDNGSGGLTVLPSAQDLGAAYGVTLAVTRDTIRFDNRGMLINAGAALPIVISKGTMKDSVCLVGLGKISTRGCTL